MNDRQIYNENEPAKMLLNKKMNGVFYTPAQSAQFLANRILAHTTSRSTTLRDLEILDPMVGSGDLLVAFCEEVVSRFPEEDKKRLADFLPNMIYGTDKDQEGVERTRQNLAQTVSNLTGTCVDPSRFSNILKLDALRIGEIEKAFPHIFAKARPGFSLIIANPPWEVVKVNDREFFSVYDSNFRRLSKEVRAKRKEGYLLDNRIRDLYESYVKKIVDTQRYITDHYKLIEGRSEINLYRTSLERILQLSSVGSIVGVITPMGLAGEQGAYKIREELLSKNAILEMWGFSISAKLFPEADVSALITVFRTGGKTDQFIYVSDIDSTNSAFSLLNQNLPRVDHRFLIKLSPQALTFTPISNKIEFSILQKMYRFPMISCQTCGLWNMGIGREFDETNDRAYLTNEVTPYRFLKGRDVSPFQIMFRENRWVSESYPKFVQKSYETERIVWRDIARANKERRMFATIAPANYVLGNSLNYFKERLTAIRRRYLLGVWSSLLIEYRLRQLSTNNHFNMYVTRQIPVPRLDDENPFLKEISSAVNQLLTAYSEEGIYRLEALVAYLYGLDLPELRYILSRFPKIDDKMKDRIIAVFESIQVVQNHDTATLSELDLKMVKSIPEGGNWKNIPKTIPSKRLDQIRRNFKLGNGSRSTYYGRLERTMPAYTISTHFARPGNGCNIHPTQDRTLSVREAARLQSFPDWFLFKGSSRASIFKQIGNAVPPLLAYAVAKTLPKGNVVDLFSGAGGMSLGFRLAGHDIFSALEIDEDFAKTYSENISTINEVVVGDIRDDEVVGRLMEEIRETDAKIDIVIGGPPCQGFSEAGNKRSPKDPRNNLYQRFIHVVKLIQPRHFVMENVPGLLTLKKGTYYSKLMKDYTDLQYKIIPLILWAHEYGVPQRRKRIFIVGTRNQEYSAPLPLFSISPKSNLPKAISSGDALGNLSPVQPNAWLMKSSIDYSKPCSDYVRWLRGLINIDEMLQAYGAKTTGDQKALGDYFQ